MSKGFKGRFNRISNTKNKSNPKHYQTRKFDTFLVVLAQIKVGYVVLSTLAVCGVISVSVYRICHDGRENLLVNELHLAIYFMTHSRK